MTPSESSGERPLVSILCLSYNRPDLLRAALGTLISQTYPKIELWVVDNRSPHSDEITRLSADFAQVRLLSIFRNRGFTGGMNAGLDNVSGDYVLLTADDTLLDADFVTRLVDYVQRNPETGVATGVLRNRAAGTVLSAGGAVYLGPIWQRRMLAHGDCDPGSLSKPVFVQFAPGGLMFASARLFRQLKGFRRDFFLHYEDVELCLRVQRLGRPIVVVPDAKAQHFEPLDRPDRPVMLFHKAKNLLALYVLHARFAVLASALWNLGVRALLRAARGSEFAPELQARLWFLANLPRLFLDRWQIRVECRPEIEEPR